MYDIYIYCIYVSKIYIFFRYIKIFTKAVLKSQWKQSKTHFLSYFPVTRFSASSTGVPLILSSGSLMYCLLFSQVSTQNPTESPSVYFLCTVFLYNPVQCFVPQILATSSASSLALYFSCSSRLCLLCKVCFVVNNFELNPQVVGYDACVLHFLGFHSSENQSCAFQCPILEHS